MQNLVSSNNFFFTALQCRFYSPEKTSILTKDVNRSRDNSTKDPAPGVPYGTTGSVLSLRAFVMTDTELKLMAAAAIIGDRMTPRKG